MNDQDESRLTEERPQLSEPESAAGESESIEENAPATTEQNEGMSTVLGTDPIIGVLSDTVEE